MQDVACAKRSWAKRAKRVRRGGGYPPPVTSCHHDSLRFDVPVSIELTYERRAFHGAVSIPEVLARAVLKRRKFAENFDGSAEETAATPRGYELLCWEVSTSAAKRARVSLASTRSFAARGISSSRTLHRYTSDVHTSLGESLCVCSADKRVKPPDNL